MKLLLILAFALSSGVFALSFSLPGRVGTLGSDPGCFHALYARDHKEAAVVMIGSSRLQRGFDPDQMAAALDLPNGGVVNLAHPGSDPLFDFEILQEMLDKNRIAPKVILAGVIPTSWRQHELEKGVTDETPAPRMALSAGQANISAISGSGAATLASMARQEEHGPALTLWNTLQLHARRLENHVKLAIAGRSTWDAFVVEDRIMPDRSNICFRKGWMIDREGAHKVEAKEGYQRLFGDATLTGALDPHDFLTNPRYLAERKGLRHVARMAAARSIEAYALYLPGVHTPQLPHAFLDRFQAEIGMPVLTFPPELRDALGEVQYIDPTHLRAAGRAMASDWLAARLAPVLAAP